jgi:HK97 gp10 family phage protein
MPMRYVGLGILLAKGRAAVLEATTECAEDLVAKSQANTPIDTGTLQGSQHVASVTQSGLKVEAVISTGGEADEYAIPVHEGTSRGMPAHKYMERALVENAPLYAEAMARASKGQF